ncbi:MAG TPA: hypothetical protein VGJ93_02860 [Desulfuromonadaceae bacterium]|jgi:hypothetical protein
MFKYLFMMATALAFAAVPVWSAEKSPAVFTQKNLGRMIVHRFGWDAGLSKEISDRDYLLVLGGQRTFRFEAEDVYNPKTDRVSLADYNLHGPFTGRGWLQGTSDTTSATFSVMVPMGGEYRLKAVLQGNGFIWTINGNDYKAGSVAGGFSEVDCGTITLKPGAFQIKLAIPPGGGIDSFSFVAPNYHPIQPFSGWRFREPLTADRLSEVAVSLMNLYDKLPVVNKDVPPPMAAVDVALPSRDASPSVVSYLGAFSSRAWLRAGFRGAEIRLPIRVKETGIYKLRVRVLGVSITGDVNGTSFSVAGKQYLDLLDLGVYRLDSGENMLTVKLPPMGGLDMIQFTRLGTSAGDFMLLAGLNGAPDRQVGADEADKLIRSIQEKYPVRK